MSEPSKVTPAILAISLFLIVIWGSAFTLVGYAVDYVPPLWLVIYRLLIGGALVVAWTYLSGNRLPSLRDPRWLWYLAMGISGSILPFFLLAKGQVYVDSGLTAIIVGAAPLITIILAHFLTTEKLTRIKLFGFVIGFFGVILLFLPDDFSLELVEDWRAQLLILIAGTSYATTTVLAKMAPKTPSSVGGSMMLLGAMVTGLIIGLITGLPETLPPVNARWALLALGVGSTGIAQILFLYVIEKTGPTYMANVNYFIPVSSVIFGVWLLDEPFTLRMVLGLIIIAIGVIISRLRRKPAKRPIGGF